MGVVAGADEAEQTPQAAAQTPQTTVQTAQAPEQAPRVTRGAASTAGQSPNAASTAAEQSSAIADHSTQNQGQQTPEVELPAEQVPPTPGFGERGRMRRRARFLRKARELAYRDLGGLVFDLHRFGQRNDPLVLAKLATLREINTELRGLEDGLRDHRPVTVLREVGIAACPRCAAIHGNDDRFCPGCGLTFDANADRPISTAPVASQVQATLAPAQAPLATPPAATTPASASGPAPIAVPVSTPTPAIPSAPPLKPTAEPVAAKPAATPAVTIKTSSSPPATEIKPAAPPSASKPKDPERALEDEPTQILRPPGGDASP
jgi:hypothetical protein